MDQEETQMIDYQMQQLQQVVENIDKQLEEMAATILALNEFEKLEGKEDVLFPIANGLFAKGIASKEKTLHVNIGGNVMAEKTIQETIVMMQKQEKELAEYRNTVVNQINTFVQKLGQE